MFVSTSETLALAWGAKILFSKKHKTTKKAVIITTITAFFYSNFPQFRAKISSIASAMPQARAHKTEQKNKL